MISDDGFMSVWGWLKDIEDWGRYLRPVVLTLLLILLFGLLGCAPKNTRTSDAKQWEIYCFNQNCLAMWGAPPEHKRQVLEAIADGLYPAGLDNGIFYQPGPTPDF